MKLERIILAGMAALSVASMSCQKEKKSKNEIDPEFVRLRASYLVCEEEPRPEPQQFFTPFKDEMCWDTVPQSVREYELYVKEHKLSYAPRGDESYCHAFPGKYLDIHKQGVCDEFALHAMLHLWDARDIKELYLVFYDGKLDRAFPACNGWTTWVGHMVTVYKNENGSFGSISNGRDERIVADSIRKVMKESARKIGFLHLTNAGFISKSNITPYLKERILDDSSERDINPELEYRWDPIP